MYAYIIESGVHVHAHKRTRTHTHTRSLFGCVYTRLGAAGASFAIRERARANLLMWERATAIDESGRRRTW